MSRLPRIAWVIPTMRVGGTELQLVQLMRGLADTFELTLYCTRTEGALIGDARRAGAYVRLYPTRSGWDPGLERQLHHAFSAHRPDIVHTYLSGFDLFANRAARRVGVPVLLSSRRELPTWQRARHRWVQRRANGYVDGVLANSQAAANFAIEKERLPEQKVHVIYNGIEAERFVCPTPNPLLRQRFKLPENGPIVGMVANFSPVKDHELFVDMARIVRKRMPRAHFLLVGSGPTEGHVTHLIHRAGLKDHVTRRQSLGEIADLYAVMDVCVLTSKVEGFPNVVLEALAAGRPMVAGAVGGIPEILRHEDNGLLIPDRQPEAFADAVLHTLENVDVTRKRVHQAYHEVREQFTIERMVREHEAYYSRMLQRAHRV